MTAEQDEIICGLRGASLQLGSWDKSFVQKLYFSKKDFKLSPAQIEWIYRLLYKYRAQLPVLYEKHKENEFCKPKNNHETN